jgi:hypothetical protein
LDRWSGKIEIIGTLAALKLSRMIFGPDDVWGARFGGNGEQGWLAFRGGENMSSGHWRFVNTAADPELAEEIRWRNYHECLFIHRGLKKARFIDHHGVAIINLCLEEDNLLTQLATILGRGYLVSRSTLALN